MARKYIIPLHEMPKLPSGKSNRKELRAIASSMIALELSKYALDSTNTSGLRITPQFSGGEDAARNLGSNIGYRVRSILPILPTSRLLNLGLFLGVALKFTNLKEMTKTPNHHPPQNPHPLSSNLLSSRKLTYLQRYAYMENAATVRTVGVPWSTPPPKSPQVPPLPLLASSALLARTSSLV